MEWISVKHFLPGIDEEWVIVRAIDKDLNDFYFSAWFINGNWKYFTYSDDYDGLESSINTLQITHWMVTPKFNDDFFTRMI